MKSKSTLVMIEHIVMLLVFVLAATVCVRMFVLSDRLSRKYEATDRAVLVAQNTAEAIKKNGIAWLAEEVTAKKAGENVWKVYYDEAWKVTEASSAEYVAEVTAEDAGGFLFRAEIVISTVEGTELFRLPVAAQTEAEVTADETN